MILITLAFIALTLMITSYAFKRPGVSVAGGITWLIFGIWSMTLSTATWDVYYDLFILGFGMFLMGLIESMGLRPETKDESPSEDIWDRGKNEYLKNKQAQSERLNEFKSIIQNKKVSRKSRSNYEDDEI